MPPEVTTSTYRLLDHGRELTVEFGTDGGHNTALLLVDGDQHGAVRGWRFDTKHFSYGGHRINVAWWWTGKVRLCELVERNKGARLRVMFEPPADTRAYAVWQLQRDRPGVYAARHVGIAVLRLLVGILGISALLSALLPHLSFGWLPDADLPDVHVPNLLGWVPPLFGWVPDVTLPAWLHAVLMASHFWVPILIATAIAVREYERRKKRSADEIDEADAEEDRSDDHAQDDATRPTGPRTSS